MRSGRSPSSSSSSACVMPRSRKRPIKPAEAAASQLAEAIAQQKVISQQEVTAGERVGLRKQELDAEIRAVADADADA